MEETNITSQTPLLDAFEEYKKIKSWAPFTTKCHERNVNDFILDMKNNDIEPIIENVTYSYVLNWVKRMEEQYKPKTIKQKISTFSTLFSHLNHLGIVNSNYFAALDAIEDYDDEHHSRALSLEELYSVYKAAHELQAMGVNVLISTVIEIFTALRSTSLKKLTVSSLSIEQNGLRFKRGGKKGKGNEDSKRKERGNHKNKEFFLPLPPKTMSLLIEHIKGLDPNEPLLYGLKGNPLANKQMNYITNKICEHLNWMEKKVNEEGEEEVYKTEQFFSPHAFRYTLSTLFDEMGVPRDTNKFLLLHSNKNFDSLDPYILRFNRHIQELKAAQILVETVLETALELDMKYNIKLDFNDLSKELGFAYKNQLYNEQYYAQFKEQIITKALSQIIENLQIPLQTALTLQTNHMFSGVQQMVPQIPTGAMLHQQTSLSPVQSKLDQLMSLLKNII